MRILLRMPMTTPRRPAAKRPGDPDPARVRARRVELGLNQRSTAALAGISAGHLCEIERGTRNPSPALLSRLAEVLKCRTRDLMSSAA